MQWRGAERVTSHFPNQCWPSTMTYIFGTRGRWVNYMMAPSDVYKNIDTHLIQSPGILLNALSKIILTMIIINVFANNFFKTTVIFPVVSGLGCMMALDLQALTTPLARLPGIARNDHRATVFVGRSCPPNLYFENSGNKRFPASKSCLQHAIGALDFES